MSEQSLTRVPAPSAAGVREQIGRIWELWLGAMFLKRETYAYERDQKNPFGNGLVYIAIIGVLVALAGILGAGLRYATLPSLEAIKNTVLTHLQAMPFYPMLDTATASAFDRGFDQTWDTAGSLFVGYPVDANSFATLVASILTTPLGLVIGWLVYGALVHLIARGWNRETSFGEMLAPLALASSPQVLTVLTLFPGAEVSGAAVGLWTFICNVVAVRVAYQTTTGRAVWAAFFPILLLLLVLLLLLILLIAILIPISRSVGGPQ
jgi:hypothetical protein